MTKDEYQFYKAHGFCVICRHNKAIKGQTKCATCKEKALRYQRGYVEEHKAKIKETQKIYQYARYHRLKDAGLCVICGKTPAEKGKSRCTECFAKERKKVST